jgi:hypothetical protein
LAPIDRLGFDTHGCTDVDSEKLSPDDLRRIAPTNLESIYLRGTFGFPLRDYAGRILRSNASACIETSRQPLR